MFGKKTNTSEKVRRESMGIAGIPEDNDSLKTVLRIRPTEGIDDYADDYIQILPETNEVIYKPPFRGETTGDRYKFDNVFGPEVRQKEVFNSTAEELVKAAFEGKNACLFTYGASGSGKTHTIMGGSGENEGVLPRSLETIFSHMGGDLHRGDPMMVYGSFYTRTATRKDVKEQNAIVDELNQVIKDQTLKSAGKRRSLMRVPTTVSGSIKTLSTAGPDGTYAAFASFYELYNEKVYDLLEKPAKNGKRKELQEVKQDKKGAYVDKIRHVQIESKEDAYRVLEAGRKNLSVGQTRLNKDSSRSHCLFTVRICKRVGPETWQVSSLAFCDLAGTEKMKHLGNATQRTIAESKTINQSLMSLRIVISSLQNQQKSQKTKVAVMFRNSKLTRLMQHYLVGHAKTTIIVAVSNNPKQFEETSNSLKFASTAQAIQLGLDRHGKALKESDKLNYSLVKKTSLESTTSVEPLEEVEQNVWTNFSREDFIADLEYYIERETQLTNCIQDMKVEWQRDEIKWKEDKVFWRQARKDWEIDLANAKIQASNDHAEHEYNWQVRMEKRVNQIRELRDRLRENKADQGLTEQNEKLTLNNTELEKEISDLRRKLAEKDQNARKLQTELEMAQNDVRRLEETSKRNDEEIVTLRANTGELQIHLGSKDDELLEMKRLVEESQKEIENCKEELRQKLHEPRSVSPVGSPLHRSSIVPGFLETTTMVMRDPESQDSEDVAEDREMAELREQNDLLERDVETFKSQLKQGREMYSQLMEEKNLALEKLEELKEKHDLIEGELNNAKALSADSGESKKMAENLAAEKGSLILELEANGKIIADLTDQLSDEKMKLSEIRQELEVVQDENDQKDAFIDELKSSLKESQESVGRSQNDANKELAEKVAHLDELNKQLNSDVAENLAELDFMSKDIHAKQKEIKALSDNVKELEEEADARVSEIETLQGKLSAKEAEIASKSVELTDRRKSRRLAGEREKQQEQKIEALTEQLEQVKIQAKEENTQDESFAAEVEELKEKIQRLSDEIAEKDKKYERSILRKQKEKALKELEDTKAKIGQLESVLALKENEIAQLKVSNSEMTQMALESVSSASTVKTEPGLDSESENQPKVKPEPEDEYVPKDSRPTRVRRLAPGSPEPLARTPSAETLPPRRALRSRKGKR